MKASVSGQSAVAIVRDRKTGKIKDMETEKAKIIEKSAKTLELERKYEKWGKGYLFYDYNSSPVTNGPKQLFTNSLFPTQ